MNFKLNNKELERYLDFWSRHKDCRDNDVSNTYSAGGSIDVIFTPTPIGNVITMKCKICDKSENITDFDSW